MDASNIVTLLTGGYEHRGLVSGTVDIDLERAYRSFRLELAQSWPSEKNPVRIYPGDTVDLLVGDDLLLSGYIDSVTANAAGRPLSVSGRSRTADLCDCSCIPADGRNSLSWKQQTVGQIAADLASPYGIDVLDEVRDTERIDFRAKVDETAYSAIERLCRESQALVTDDEGGNLRIMRPGGRRGPSFALPGNVTDGATSTHDASNRYTDYVVRGQVKGTDSNYYTALASRVVAFDDWTSRKRVHTVVAERKMDSAACTRRAIWECVTRAGRAVSCSLPVVGWRDRNGDLYHPGDVCAVNAPTLGIVGDMILGAVSYSIDRASMTAVLSMTLPGMYEPEAPRAREAARKGAITAPADGYWRGEV